MYFAIVCFSRQEEKTDERGSSSLFNVVILAASRKYNLNHSITTPAVSHDVLLVSIT